MPVTEVKAVPVPAIEAGKKRWRLARMGGATFWISVFLHIFLAAVATFIVVQHFSKKHIDFHATSPPAPPTEVEHKVQLAKKNNVESAPPDLKRITTTAVTPVALPDVPVVPTNDDPTPSPMNGLEGLGSGMGGGKGTGGNGAGVPAFGATGGLGLQGFLYDLKQSPGKKATGMDYQAYQKILIDFAAGGFNEEDLKSYYKSPHSLTSSVFAITPRGSGEAPKAFAVENEMQAGLWLAYYQGTVTPPESGEYQFVGFADDVLLVTVDGNVVLDGGVMPVVKSDIDLSGDSRRPLSKAKVYPHVWSSRHAPFINGNMGRLRIGTPFRVTQGISFKMQVILGDVGGDCTFFLLLQDTNKVYDKLPDGTPLLPLFQLTEAKPTLDGDRPPMARDPVVWSAAEP